MLVDPAPLDAEAGGDLLGSEESGRLAALELGDVLGHEERERLKLVARHSLAPDSRVRAAFGPRRWAATERAGGRARPKRAGLRRRGASPTGKTSPSCRSR
jgi:hypothetical protein